MDNNLLESLETRLTFQEDLIQKLDDALSSQQQQLLEMRRDLHRLLDQMRDLESNLPAPEDPPPPHY